MPNTTVPATAEGMPKFDRSAIMADAWARYLEGFGMKKTRKPILPSSLSSQLSSGKAAHDEIQQVADYLADLMRNVYGGTWRVSVSHESRFVMVAEDL